MEVKYSNFIKLYDEYETYLIVYKKDTPDKIEIIPYDLVEDDDIIITEGLLLRSLKQCLVIRKVSIK